MLKTELIESAENGDRTAVENLLTHGAAVDQADKYGYTALHVAAAYGHEATARLLLESGAAVDQANRNGKTALHYASQYGKTALHYAAENGKTGVAKLLLENGAAVDQADGDFTALHFAAGSGHEALTELLLATGADVNGARLDGETPLFLAARYGHETVARLLLENGAAPNKASLAGHTPSEWACFMGHMGVRAAFETHLDWRQYMPLLKQILTPSSNKETAPEPEPEPETTIAVTRQKIVDGVLEIDQLDGDTSRRVIDALLRDTPEQRLAWAKFLNPRLSSKDLKFPCPELMTKIGEQFTAATATIEKFAKIIAALFDLQDYINAHKDERKAAAEEILKNLLALTESGEIVSQDNYIKVVECLSLKNYKEFFELTRLYGLTGLQNVFNKIAKRFDWENHNQRSQFIELKNVLDSTRAKAAGAAAAAGVALFAAAADSAGEAGEAVEDHSHSTRIQAKP